MKKRIIKYGGSMAGFPEWRALVKSVTKSVWTGNWQTGPETALFEKELAEAMDMKHAIMTSSGSCAGLLALSALELPKGSEVIIPAVTFPTIFNMILQCELVPVVVDCDPNTNNIDLSKLEDSISRKTRAIIAVHALGNPVDMPRLMRMVNNINQNRAENNRSVAEKIYVIEDNCDGFGTTIGSEMAGSFGHISLTSTHAAHIITTGVGGVVFTNDPELDKKVRMYRDWGRQANTNEPNKYPELPADYNPRFIYEKIGYNFQILELQSAMGRVQLRKAKKIKELRARNFRYLFKNLPADIKLPRFQGDWADPCWFAMPLRYENRGSLVKFLEGRGIETRSMFSGNILKHPAYKGMHFRVGKGGLKGADKILTDSFWISCHPSLSKKDLRYIVEVFNEYFFDARTA